VILRFFGFRVLGSGFLAYCGKGFGRICPFLKSFKSGMVLKEAFFSGIALFFYFLEGGF